MKSFAAGFILTIIAAALFLALMGSDDPVIHRVPPLNFALPLSFVYGVCAFGLIKYRRRNFTSDLVGFALSWLGAVVVFFSWFTPRALSVANWGRTLFAFALADIAIAFFVPWRNLQMAMPNHAPDPASSGTPSSGHDPRDH
jgi:hypothetical protein